MIADLYHMPDKRKQIAIYQVLKHYIRVIMSQWKQKILLISASVFVLLAMPTIAMAAQSASPNYQVNEAFFGAGGELNSCSGQYCAKQSIGELATGKICSNGSYGYCAQAGFNTDRSPYIQVTVSNTNVDLGTLTPSSTKTANSSFEVKSYLAQGYSVINASDPPKNGTHTLAPLSTPTASIVGDEQFGINLVDNTSPINFGDDPAQNPDATFSFGQAATDYDTANFYKYAKGDSVALSNSSTSTTDYTVSYIFNVSNLTPGGQYDFYHVLVATATF